MWLIRFYWHVHYYSDLFNPVHRISPSYLQFMKDAKGAMYDFQAAIKLDTNYALAYFNAANIYFKNKQFRQVYRREVLFIDYSKLLAVPTLLWAELSTTLELPSLYILPHFLVSMTCML